MRWYLVGGAVRDILLGLAPREWDLAFSGTAEEMIQAYPDTRTVGHSVSVCMLEGVECMPLRGGSLESDLRARDLTINALALDDAGLLHTHPQGLEDLRNAVLRPASPTAFADDPARVFRLARFAATLPDFSVHADALLQAAACRPALHALPAERVGNEVRKALRAPRPSRFLRVLGEAGCLFPWLQELDNAAAIPAGPLRYHNGSVLDHTCDIMDAVQGDELAVWMALCHDLGKLTTPPDILPHHYGHEERGAAAASTLARRLALPRRHALAGALAAREHMKGGIFPTLRVGTQRDLLYRVHAAGLDIPFWKVVDADLGSPMSVQAMRTLRCMLEVQLPLHLQNKGKSSGERLRLLQCEAITRLAASGMS